MDSDFRSQPKAAAPLRRNDGEEEVGGVIHRGIEIPPPWFWVCEDSYFSAEAVLILTVIVPLISVAMRASAACALTLPITIFPDSSVRRNASRGRSFLRWSFKPGCISIVARGVGIALF